MQELQSRNERMFLLTFLVVSVADNRQRLGNNVFQAGSIAQKYNCQLTRLDFQQEEGFMSALPLGYNQIEIQRGLTTSSVAIFVPFTTQELFQDGKEALYCGLNALSNNLIMVDRKLLKNPNGLILGTPGSGKSFSAKREIANVFLVTNDDIIICDPEAEYGPLVEHLHGQVVKISPTSTDYLNPMDLNLNYSDDENPLSLKSDFILSLCELIVGGKDGLMPVEKTIIDRCVRSVYREYLSDPRPEKMPILEDLYNELRRQDEKEAQYIATALEIYVTGSLNVFNHRSNVNIENRYEVHRDGLIGAVTFIYRKGELQTYYIGIRWKESGVPEIQGTSVSNVAEIKLTEKGYFIYAYEYVIAHASLRQYWRIEPLPEDCRELTEKYISGLSYVNYNLLVTDWDSSNVEDILMPCMYEDVYRISTGENLKTEGWKIPAEEYERIMTTYFPVSVEQLREHCGYDEGSNSYEYEMIYASPYPPFGEVVDYTKNADGTITLIVDGVWPDYNSDLAFRNTVVVQPFEDGTFRYLSNSIEQIKLELPPIARKKE